MANTIPAFIMAGTYQQYKEDTQYCIEWLVDTATEAGHDMSRYRRLTSKVQTAWGTRNASMLNIHVQTNDFLPLARSISSKWPRIVISDVFMRRLRAALQARRVCASYYIEDADAAVEEENRKHQHFISALQSVHDCLRPLHVQQQATHSAPRIPPPVTLSSPSTNATVSSREQLANKFGKLKVHKAKAVASAGDMQPPANAMAEPSASPTPKHHVTFEEVSGRKGEHRSFSVHCLLLDLHRLRLFVGQKWLEYRNGKCDLVVASVIMNTAIEISSRLQDDMVRTLGLKHVQELLLLTFDRDSIRRAATTETLRAAVIEFENYSELFPYTQEFAFTTEFVAASDFMQEMENSKR